jgi:predicted alpha/beta-fold hydrolase
MPNYEDVEIKTSDGKVIHGWLIKRKDARLFPTIIHFHGNACDISHMLYDALGMFQKVKVNILLVDYRGYGMSEGVRSEKHVTSMHQCAHVLFFFEVPLKHPSCPLLPLSHPPAGPFPGEADDDWLLVLALGLSLF